MTAALEVAEWPAGTMGRQVPRISLTPPCVSNRGPEAVALARIAGLGLYPWQEAELIRASGVDERGKWAAFEYGLIANRQNGKGEIILARQLAGLFLWGERLQIHSSHDFKTTQQAFARIVSVIDRNPLLSEQVERIRTADGEESVETVDGNVLRFLARARNQARGFTGDTIYLDEALKLPTTAINAMVPTLAARTITANPQIWYTSSAGLEDSEILESVRARGMNPESPRLAFAEYSVPSDADPADERTWLDANPMAGVLIARSYFEGRWAAATNPQLVEGFKREHLGIWAEIGGQSAFPAAN